MGDHRQSLVDRRRTSETEGKSEGEGYDDALNLQSVGYETLGSKDPIDQDLNNGELGSEDQEEEIPPEEVSEEEFLDAQDPGEAPPELKTILKEVEEDDVPEMSRLSITQRFPGTSMVRRRKKRRRLFELAKPKTNWQVLKDRMGCCCKGYAWISPCMRTLQFCVYWPSVYWTEKFLEDTTLTVTMPAVSRRLEELAQPRRFCLDYYSNERITPMHPIPRSTLDYRSSSRLIELATPRIRNNIWSINMSEVSQVSRAAQVATPSSRILQLAKPRAPATLLDEWDPVPKPKPRVSDYNRLLYLAMPKVQSEKCIPDRNPRWEVLEVTKKAVASPRIISLAKPKVRKDLNEGYDPYYISPASLAARASPRLYELATPKSITKKV
ncbi:theg spermatid protein [Phyllostomus discolor]|uniref:Theg spermatid protein n=1 Tax=Phyllostomus discolor TaxID=89673 RepID=A0A834E188_9CHIR|nr:theg spermatid protein [Phyllostomus discolor]